MSVQRDCEPFWSLVNGLVDAATVDLPPLLINCTTADSGNDTCVPLTLSEFIKCNSYCSYYYYILYTLIKVTIIYGYKF